jgi:hypothetical protein
MQQYLAKGQGFLCLRHVRKTWVENVVKKFATMEN